jgi:SAM-dependent methyltransferase
MSDLSSYAKHARVWGYYAGDISAEAIFWETLAKRNGSRVLALMCATGEMAADLAGRGLRVCGVDFILEMIQEAERRWGEINNLTFAVGDVRALNLLEKDFDFAFTSDFHHLLTQADCMSALAAIHEHLRNGGGVALELSLPGEESWSSPWRTFEPTRADPSLPPLKTWKKGRTSYDAGRRVVSIEQEVYLQEPGQEQPEMFVHKFDLQLWERQDVKAMLREAGFVVVNEYSDYVMKPWESGDNRWIVEAVKSE